MRYLLIALLLMSATSCVGAAAERDKYEAQHRAACLRLQEKPRSLLEKIVADPETFPHELWAQAHPEAPTGSLYKSEIRSLIGAHIKGVRVCYESAMRGWPAAEGKVTFRFGIGPSGSVDAVAVVANETKVHPLACCIAEVLRPIRFQAPDGGGPVIVTYPFVLEQTRRSR